MKASELRKKTLPELFKLLDEERNKLFKLRMDKALGKLKQTHLLKMTRKNIARILTVINEIRRENAKKESNR